MEERNTIFIKKVFYFLQGENGYEDFLRFMFKTFKQHEKNLEFNNFAKAIKVSSENDAVALQVYNKISSEFPLMRIE